MALPLHSLGGSFAPRVPLSLVFALPLSRIPCCFCQVMICCRFKASIQSLHSEVTWVATVPLLFFVGLNVFIFKSHLRPKMKEGGNVRPNRPILAFHRRPPPLALVVLLTRLGREKMRALVSELSLGASLSKTAITAQTKLAFFSLLT